MTTHEKLRAAGDKLIDALDAACYAETLVKLGYLPEIRQRQAERDLEAAERDLEAVLA